MKKVGYLIGVLVLLNIVLFGINQFNERRGTKSAATVSKSAVSVPIRTEQKTYRVSFRVAPVVQSQAKSQ